MSEFIEGYLKDLLRGLRFTQTDLNGYITSAQSGLVDTSDEREVIEYLAREAQFRINVYYDFYILAGRILVKHQLNQIPSKFSEHIRLLYCNYREVAEGVREHVPVIDEKYHSLVRNNREFFDSLEKFFKLTCGNKVDCVQYMLLRIALQLYSDNFSMLKECYRMMTEIKVSMATPIRANSCMPKNPLASCFITCIKDDSIDGIFKTLHDVAMISKNDGGIGVDITDIRPSGDCIKVSGGISSGVGMMLRVFNETMKYVDQGGNKCRGAMMVNMAIWHLDISDFLRIRHHSRVAELRAANLHHCITIPDIFMRRVHANGDWTMFSPRDAEILLGKKLNGLYSDEFETGYLKCERLKNRKTIKARVLLFEICRMQCETGEPFLFFIDGANEKSNQKNLGSIMTLNLCTEIIERSNGMSVCNLRAVILLTHVRKKEFDFVELQRSVRLLDDEAACDLNKRIFAMIYYAALEESCDLAMVNGPYDGYSGSPVSKGILHCDSWGVELDKQLDWASLRNRIKRYGIRNSLLVGPMPTASTSQCVKMGFSEGLFPDESNITLCETTSEGLIRQIQENRGGVQNIESFPEDMMRVYRTTFEYDYDVIIDQAIDCAPYIDQSQSMNNYVASENPDAMIKQLFNSHQRAWGGGLKRLYYMKSMSVSRPLNLKVDDMQRYASRKICNEEGQCDSCAV
ncbi:hypothetical protein C2G38_2267749 [Gigaspora rosea]|uniref:Ribonucleotide reductase large subunit C-terminal domain-containing protein n=1 Tax=Gigaspora rosea TaxID=44941 RepID=A0A397VZE2_9GLOM|nr:hypothetical protein C2G38_2267749 [Gigaspora rosea]